MANVLNRLFQIHKDVNGYPTFLKTQLVAGDWANLIANTEMTFVVPSDSNLIQIAPQLGNDVFILIDNGSGSITPPASGTSISNSMVDQNLVGVSVSPGQTIHLYSLVDTYVKINYYYDRTVQ